MFCLPKTAWPPTLKFLLCDEEIITLQIPYLIMKAILLVMTLSLSLTTTALAAETEPSAKDLAGVEARTLADWNWAIGGQYSQPIEPDPYESSSYGLDGYKTRIETLNNTQEINDSQLGDVQRPTRRLPLVSF